MSDTDFNEWLETSIKSQDINYFNYHEFTEHKVIGEGGFGVVKSVEWKNRGIKVALKSLNGSQNMSAEYLNEVCIFYSLHVIFYFIGYI